MQAQWFLNVFDYLPFAVIGLGFGFLLLRQYLHNHAPSRTGPATIVSRREAPAKFAGKGQMGVKNNGWNYLVTFRLSDGEEIQLYTFEEIYTTLQEGVSGQLTWHNDTLSQFIPDKED